MDIERLQQLAGNSPEEGSGNNELFTNSLTKVFGLSPETVEAIVAQVSRSGDTRQIQDQQVRRRAGTRAMALLQQAHDAAGSEGDETYDDDAEMDPEADPVGDGMEDEMPEDEGIEDTMDDEGAMDVENTDERV